MRCMGDTEALAPPLMIDEAVADEILDKFEATLHALTEAVA